MTVIYTGNSVQRKTFSFPLGTLVRDLDGLPGRVVGHVKSWSDPAYMIKFPHVNRPLPRCEGELSFAPVVGLGATMRYASDTAALVVIRVTPRTLVTQAVQTKEPEVDMASDEGAWGVRPTNAQGILDQPIPGTDRRWTLNKRGQYVSHGQRLTLGHSVTRRDWRD